MPPWRAAGIQPPRNSTAQDDSKENHRAECNPEFVLSWLGRHVGGAGFCEPLSQDSTGDPDQ